MRQDRQCFRIVVSRRTIFVKGTMMYPCGRPFQLSGSSYHQFAVWGELSVIDLARKDSVRSFRFRARLMFRSFDRKALGMRSLSAKPWHGSQKTFRSGYVLAMQK